MNKILILLLLPFYLFSQSSVIAGSKKKLLGAEPAPSDYLAYYVAGDVDGDGNSGNNSGKYFTWSDLSGNGFDLSFDGVDTMSYVSSSLNGEAGMAMEGGGCNTYYAHYVTSGVASMTGVTLVLVAKHSTTTASLNSTPILSTVDDNGYLFGISHISSSGGLYLDFYFLAETSSTLTYDATPVAGDAFIAIGTWDFITDDYTFEINNGSSTSGTTANYFDAFDFSIGNGYWDLAPCFSDLELEFQEIMIFDRAISSSEVSLLMADLKTKYGL